MSLLPDNHSYSYSQLSSFDSCPYAFYLQRIEGLPEEATNGFAERGSLIHSLLDQWAGGKLRKKDMISEYERRYPEEVITAFPRMLAAKGYPEKMYNKGLLFLENFDEFEGYDILSSEEKFFWDIPMEDGTTRPFVGIIDMVLKDKKTGDIIVCDHKSKSLSSFKKAENEMYRQQLLYSWRIKEKYGEWPSSMMFHLFNEDGKKMERLFTEDQFNDTLSWAREIIHKIETYELVDWLAPKEKGDFHCWFICSARNECPNGTMPKKTKREDDYYDRENE